MLKNKFKIITLLVAIILLFSATFSFAEDNDAVAISENTEATTSDEEKTTTSEATDNASNDASQSQDNFKKGDVYLTGDNVTVDYIIDGNLFVFANNVTINSQIGGDAFICAQTVTVGEQGYIFSNLFTVSQNLEIKGVVYDVFALSQDITVSGYVYRDIKTSCGKLNIFGTIGRNAFINCSNINFTQSTTSDDGESTTVSSQGMIGGDLNYSSPNELSIQEGTVTGAVNYSKPAISINNQKTFSTYLFALLRAVVLCVALWLLGLWLAPKFFKNTASSISDKKKLLPIVGFGILTPIVMVIACIILLVLGITSNVALLLLSLLFILIAISEPVLVISISNIVCNKLKIEKNLPFLGILVAVAAILWIISLIPYVGTVITFVVSILGLGLLVKTILPKSKKIKE